MDLVEGRRPDFAEERDALDDRGIAAWKLIIHNGIAENYYAMGAASPDRESRKGYYDLASKACHNVLEAAENAYLDISLGAIISSCARLTALTAEDTSASDYCFPAKYYLNKWLRRLQRDPKGLSPEDEEKKQRLLLELEFGDALRDKERNPAASMERLITISHKMTLEHAEFPGDIFS